MNRLLHSNWIKIKRTIFFKFTLLSCIILSVFLVVMAYLSEESIGNIPFKLVTFFPFLIALIGSAFIFTDYYHNTIRNKITVGHTRTNIYMANWIIITACSLLIYIAYEGITIGAGLPILGTGDSGSEMPIYTDTIIKNMLLAIPIIINICSLVVFVSMTVKENMGLGGSLSFMLFYAFMIFSIIQTQFFENNKTMQFISNALPTTQLMALSSYAVPDNDEIVMYIASSLITAFISTIGGIAIFKRTDIK